MKNKKGFTLAEVLITLTIIGVIAALTIPSLLANVSDKTYEQKRKALQTRLAQAVAQMDSLNSYEDKEDPEANSSMNFVVNGLSKVYKITNVCEFENFAACDFPESFSYWFSASKYYTKNYKKLTVARNNIMTAENMGGLATDAVAFRTKNGESFLLWYNPRCVAEQDVDSENKKMWTKEVCATFLVDIDGAKKGSNTTGKDIMPGIILYPDTPYVIITDYNFHNPGVSRPSYSTSTNNDATAELFCTQDTAHGFPKGSLILANKEHAYVLRALYAGEYSGWTSSVLGSGPDDYAWAVNKQYAQLEKRSKTLTINHCVKKSL